MYDLPYFKEKNERVIKEFIEQHPFAFIAGCDHENKPIATQVPVFIEEAGEKKILSGHIMRKSDHHRAFMHNPNVLVVFTGNHTYVSATWYSDPHQASTWNYMSVHAKGLIRFLDDSGLEAILRKTTLHFENQDKKSTTIFDNLPEDYKRNLMKGIVAFEIEVTDMQNVFKLSQNRDKRSYNNIIEKLKQHDADAKTIADEMKKRIDNMFPPE